MMFKAVHVWLALALHCFPSSLCFMLWVAEADASAALLKEAEEEYKQALKMVSWPHGR